MIFGLVCFLDRGTTLISSSLSGIISFLGRTVPFCGVPALSGEEAGVCCGIVSVIITGETQFALAWEGFSNSAVNRITREIKNGFIVELFSSLNHKFKTAVKKLIVCQ